MADNSSTIKNLFFIYNSRISVIKFHQKSKKLEFVTKNGEKEFEIEEDFWEWWKKALSYIEDNTLDFCFLYDKEYPLMFDDFFAKAKKEENSMWNLSYIREFFREIKPEYSHVHLIMADGKEINIDGENILFKDNSVKKFYTNITEKKLIINKTDGNEREGTDMEISAVAKYFIDLMASEQKI